MFIRLLLVTLLLTSCVPNWWKPMGYTMFKKMPKDGTPGFRLGWKHGCQSGLGNQFGGGIYMYFYTWSRDPDISSSHPDINKIRKKYPELKGINWDNIEEVKKNFSDYNTVFWGAHIFCRHSVLGILQTTGSSASGNGLTAPLPGEERFDMGQHSIGRVWTMYGKGDTRWGRGLW